jgi:hypothetical protein
VEVKGLGNIREHQVCLVMVAVVVALACGVQMSTGIDHSNHLLLMAVALIKATFCCSQRLHLMAQ